MTQYIEKLIYTENTVEKELNFKPGINVIIGPKGGGKSILLKLLWMLKNNKNIIEIVKALKKFDILDLKIKWSNSDILLQLSDSEYPWNDKRSDIDDFLKQSDTVKTELHKIPNIEKERKEFLNEILKSNLEVVLKIFNETIKEFKKIPDIFTDLNNINWKEMFLEFKKFQENKLIKQLKEILLKKPVKIEKDIFYNSKETIKLIKSSQKSLEQLIFINDEKYNFFNNKLNINLNELNELNLKIINEIEKYKVKFEKYNNRILKFYNNSINGIENKIKNSKELNVRLNTDITNSKEKLKEFTNQLLKVKKLFNNLKKESLSNVLLKKTIESKEIKNFNLSIDQNININKHELIEKILRSCISKPTKTDKWLDWVKNNYKKDFVNLNKKEKINLDFLVKKVIDEFNNINQSKSLIDFVELLSKKNQKYSEMSLGERSILGIEEKLNKMKNYDVIFLDQLEDNLDNHSIQNNIINKLNYLSKDKQIFIVTHNANIGINTNVENVIVCQLDKLDTNNNNFNKNQYFNTSIDYEMQNLENTKLVHYLEGGKEALKNRFNKVFKNK